MNKAPALPRTIGRYRIEGRMGRGGMAEVFSAVHQGAAGFERRVCVKRILPHLATDQEFRDLFVKEAAVAGGLCHNNLVQVFDCVEDGQTLAIVMEMVEGVDLSKLLRYRRSQGYWGLPAGLVAYVAGQLLTGLRYAHGERVIHRDVSPHNILISRSGEVKLTDFGVAKAMLTQATLTGKLKGKLPYMSPEQASGRAVDHRTDLYSAGLVLLELLTGRRYFKRASHSELVGLITNPGPPSLSPSLEQNNLACFFKRLIEPIPEDRFEHAEQAIAALPDGGAAGPQGAVDLAKTISPELHSSLESSPSQRPPTLARSKSKLEDNTLKDDLLLVQTECILDDKSCPIPERPVVPGPRDAITATRNDDVRQALALAPTQLVTAVQAVPSNPYPDTLEDAAFAESRLCSRLMGPRPSFRRGLEFLLDPIERLSAIRPYPLIVSIAIFAVILGVILGVGGRLLWSPITGPSETITAEKTQSKRPAQNLDTL